MATLRNLIAEPESLEIDLDRTAILVVDMQNTFISQGGMFDRRGFDLVPSQAIIPSIQEICNKGREKGIKVIYIAHVLSPDLREVGPDSSFWYKSVRLYRENPEWKNIFMIRGTWGAEIVSLLKPQEGDLLVEKTRFSAFYGTPLDSILKTYNLKYLFFSGCATNICVEASIRDAASLNYFPILVSDASANNGPGFTQEATLFNVRICLGWVTQTEHFLGTLA